MITDEDEIHIQVINEFMTHNHYNEIAKHDIKWLLDYIDRLQLEIRLLENEIQYPGDSA